MVLHLHKNQAGVTVATLSRCLRSVQTNGIKAMPLATLLWLVFHMLLFRKSKSLQLFDNFLGGPVHILFEYFF